jgi:hypothetical protein
MTNKWMASSKVASSLTHSSADKRMHEIAHMDRGGLFPQILQRAVKEAMVFNH